MTAGVPGTGIGGLFYLTAALALPLRAAVLRTRGIRVAWPTIFRQLRLAIGVSLSLWAMGWFIGFALGPVVATAQGIGPHGGPVQAEYQSVLRWAALFVGYATLVVVLLFVQIARLVVRPRTT
jgi:hypothetical protein